MPALECSISITNAQCSENFLQLPTAGKQAVCIQRGFLNGDLEENSAQLSTTGAHINPSSLWDEQLEHHRVKNANIEMHTYMLSGNALLGL